MVNRAKKLFIALFVAAFTFAAAFLCAELAPFAPTAYAEDTPVTQTVYYAVLGQQGDSGWLYELVIGGEKIDTSGLDSNVRVYGSGSFDSSAAKPGWSSEQGSITSVRVEKEIAPASTAQWFMGFSKCTAFDLNNLKTDNVTDMSSMFSGCKAVTSLDLSSFAASKVASMASMFNDCTKLKSVDLSNFSTSAESVSFNKTFNGCNALDKVVFSKNTVKVNDAATMFYNCKKLRSLDLSSFEIVAASTSDNITLLMLNGCTSLTKLIIPKSISNATITLPASFVLADGGMKGQSVSSLTTSDLSGGTTLTREIDYVWYITGTANSNCSLYISSDSTLPSSYLQEGTFKNTDRFDGASLPPWRQFGRSYNNYMKKVSVEGNVAPVSTAYWFSELFGLTTVDFSGLITDDVEDMSYMFYRCPFTTLDLSGFTVKSGTNTEQMFSLCKELETLVAPKVIEAEIALPGTFLDGSSGKAVTSLTSANAGHTLTKHEHSGGTATCIVKAECEVCKESYGEFGAHNLSPVEEVSADCTSDGVRAHDHCSVCGKNFIENVEKTADELKIEALGHSYGEWTVTKGATCTEKGEETRVCSRDGEHKETREIEALGHSYGDWTVTKGATCTEKGEETCVCSRDNDHKETREIEALGHSYGEWTVTKEATCTEKGEETRVCSRDGDHKEMQEIDVLSHSYGEWIAEIPATETENGTKGHKDCTVCGKHFDADGNEIADLVVPTVVNEDNGSDGGQNEGLSDGAIAGISVAGAVAVLLIVYILLYFLLYKKGSLKGKFWNGIFAPMNAMFNRKQNG